MRFTSLMALMAFSTESKVIPISEGIPSEFRQRNRRKSQPKDQILLE